MKTPNLRRRKEQFVGMINRGEPQTALQQLTVLLEEHADDAELAYLAGMAQKGMHQYAEARTSLTRAARLNPKYAEPWLQLAIIEMILCRFNKAAEFLNGARKRKYNSTEIARHLREIKRVEQPQDVTLSACLIVKNERKHLPGCLRSLQAVVDEIIVVDTGSEDETVEIAKSFGAKVFDYEWQRDFAAARNYAITKATSEWIIQLDADEELFPQDQGKVRELIHQNMCDAAYLALHNRVSSSFGENKPTIHYLVRLYKNRKDFYYENPVHEILRTPGKVIAVDINLLHHGYNLETDFMKTKRQRNAEILNARLVQDPNSVTTAFYLCMMHVGNRDFDKAETFGRKVLDMIPPDNKGKQHLLLMTLNNMAMIHIERSDYETAKDFCRQATSLNPNYLDPLYFLGLSYLNLNEYDEAKATFLEYLRRFQEQKDRPVFNLFGSSAESYLYHVYHFLGKIYRRQKDNAQAIEMFVRSVELNDKFWIGHIDLGYAYVDLQNLQKAADHLDIAIKIARTNPDVNEENKVFWFDFMNAIKTYMRVLKKLREQKQAAALPQQTGA